MNSLLLQDDQVPPLSVQSPLPAAYPADPSTLYLMYIVGLPGEVITIEDGAVFADGKRLKPPESMRGIKYETEGLNWDQPIAGSKEHPAKLGGDEYFVLGDFTRRSNDSRIWRDSAPGHNTFAVPESLIMGVVTHTYWPPTRWRAFR